MKIVLPLLFFAILATSVCDGVKLMGPRTEGNWDWRVLDEYCRCTKEWNPVCASSGISYGNPCMFRCAQKAFQMININIRIVKKAEC